MSVTEIVIMYLPWGGSIRTKGTFIKTGRGETIALRGSVALLAKLASDHIDCALVLAWVLTRASLVQLLGKVENVSDRGASFSHLLLLLVISRHARVRARGVAAELGARGEALLTKLAVKHCPGHNRHRHFGHRFETIGVAAALLLRLGSPF